LDAGKQTGDFVFDTALAAYLLDSLSGCRPLAEVAKLKLNATVPDAVQNPAVIAALVPALTKELEQTGMLHLFETVELPLCEVLVEMEHNGVAADRAMLKEFGVKLSGKIEELRRKVFELAGTEFNINSPKQLGELLFEKLALPSGKKTKSGYSTDIEVLAALRDKHPVVPAVMEFRQLMKLKSTYVDGLLSEIASDGRIHTSFNMMATATGRLSSAEPNLQNIPVRTELGAEIRRMFVAEPGNVLIDADYSQIELRLLAHISGDEVMRNAFRSGFDIHTVTASQVFGVQPDAVTPEMRRRAKAVNFGIVYGISRFALAEDLGVSRKEADDYMNQYFATYSGVKRYMEEIVKTAKKRGYVATIMGRRRYLPELESPVFNIRAFGERVALNAPIQGSSADIIKLAMINTARRLRAEKRKAKLILQIHDELIIEAPLAEAEPIKTLLREEMENVMRLSVPLTVDVAAGKNWAEAK
ncbi:MAG: DNA polymerase I, partial [bacterium]|nr:DNA polymerase I [bacterium]